MSTNINYAYAAATATGDAAGHKTHVKSTE